MGFPFSPGEGLRLETSQRVLTRVYDALAGRVANYLVTSREQKCAKPNDGTFVYASGTSYPGFLRPAMTFQSLRLGDILGFPVGISRGWLTEPNTGSFFLFLKERTQFRLLCCGIGVLRAGCLWVVGSVDDLGLPG